MAGLRQVSHVLAWASLLWGSNVLGFPGTGATCPVRELPVLPAAGPLWKGCTTHLASKHCTASLL